MDFEEMKLLTRLAAAAEKNNEITTKILEKWNNVDSRSESLFEIQKLQIEASTVASQAQADYYKIMAKSFEEEVNNGG